MSFAFNKDRVKEVRAETGLSGRDVKRIAQEIGIKNFNSKKEANRVIKAYNKQNNALQKANQQRTDAVILQDSLNANNNNNESTSSDNQGTTDESTSTDNQGPFGEFPPSFEQIEQNANNIIAGINQDALLKLGEDFGKLQITASGYEDEITDLKGKKEDLQLKYDTDTADLQSKYDTDLADLQGKYDTDLAGLQRLRDDYGSLERYKGELEGNLRDFQNKYDSQLEERKADQARFEERFAAQEADYLQQINARNRSEADSQLSALRSGSTASATSRPTGAASLTSGQSAASRQASGPVMDIRPEVNATDSVLNRKGPVVDLINNIRNRRPSSGGGGQTPLSGAGASNYYASRFG